jgi:hypothetical protein
LQLGDLSVIINNIGANVAEVMAAANDDIKRMVRDRQAAVFWFSAFYWPIERLMTLIEGQREDHRGPKGGLGAG